MAMWKVNSEMRFDFKFIRCISIWRPPSPRCIVITLLVIVFFCAGPAPVLSNEIATVSQPNRPHISSDDSAIDLAAFLAEYTGNVSITFGQMEIKADKLTIYYKKTADTGSSLVAEALERCVISGNVRIVSEYGIATATEAVYDARAKTLVLTGEPATLKGNELDMSSPVIRLTNFTL